MRTGGTQNKSLQITAAVHIPDTGIPGIGVSASAAGNIFPNGIQEQAGGSPDALNLRAVWRALQLGRRLGARDVAVLCSDEETVSIVNQLLRLEPGSPLAPTYMRIRALMHTFRTAEIILVPRSRVESARRLALAASRGAHAPALREERSLFSEIQ